MKKDIENYTIRIEVRDENGKIILDENGNKQISIQYELEMLTDNMEFNLRHLSITLNSWMSNRNIEISAMVHNSISGTYMTMFSLYVKENRFVKH